MKFCYVWVGVRSHEVGRMLLTICDNAVCGSAGIVVSPRAS